MKGPAETKKPPLRGGYDIIQLLVFIRFNR